MSKRQNFTLTAFSTADPLWDIPASRGVYAGLDARTPGELDVDTPSPEGSGGVNAPGVKQRLGLCANGRQPRKVLVRSRRKRPDWCFSYKLRWNRAQAPVRQRTPGAALTATGCTGGVWFSRQPAYGVGQEACPRRTGEETEAPWLAQGHPLTKWAPGLAGEAHERHPRVTEGNMSRSPRNDSQVKKRSVKIIQHMSRLRLKRHNDVCTHSFVRKLPFTHACFLSQRACTSSAVLYKRIPFRLSHKGGLVGECHLLRAGQQATRGF